MKQHYKPHEFAELLNVSGIILQRWDNSGKLKAFRSPDNRRYYTYKQYLEYSGMNVGDNNKNNESISPSEELVQDIISILQIFSCRIHRLRKYKKKIQEDIEIEKSLQD